MAKIPFNIKFRPQIESGEYKVETRDGRPVRIICWDARADDGACIIALIPGYGGEEAYQFFPDGHAFSSKSFDEDCADLFLITPEPELSEFEVKLWEIMKAEGSPVGPREKFTNDDRKAFHEYSAQLLELVKDEIYSHESLVEYAKKAKEEALKGLPRWRRWGKGACGNGQGIPIAIVKQGLNGYKLVDALGILGEQYIMLSDLEKLPGFKEDEK